MKIFDFSLNTVSKFVGDLFNFHIINIVLKIEWKSPPIAQELEGVKE